MLSLRSVRAHSDSDVVFGHVACSCCFCCCCCCAFDQVSSGELRSRHRCDAVRHRVLQGDTGRKELCTPRCSSSRHHRGSSLHRVLAASRIVAQHRSSALQSAARGLSSLSPPSARSLSRRSPLPTLPWSSFALFFLSLSPPYFCCFCVCFCSSSFNSSQ